jgi:iron complex transport system substrate-binding protein
VKSILKKLVIFCLAAVLFTGLLTSCGKTPESTAAASTAVITDQLGRTVTLTTNNPQHIISLAPSNTEILFALGLGDRIIGVTDFDNYPPEAKTKPSVGGYTDPNIEKIIASEPDLILGTEAQSADTYQQLESKGLTVVALSPQTLDDVLATITLLGKITGKAKEAAKLTAAMQKRIKAVTDKTSKLSPDMKPRVFYIIWNDPLMTAGAGTFIDELINKAGGTNIAGDLTSYPTISLENVLTANPQVIIAGSGMGEGEDLPYKYATTEPRLQGTAARQNNRVYSINTDIIGRPGPRIIDALESFLADIHPELRDQP